MNRKIEENYITYDKHKVHVIVDNDNDIWFNGRGIAILLGYNDPHNSS